ncbi:MAG: hypothetical protein LBI87_12260 [Candidatus Accumulibacter sp.]|jgi:hypothetical protein|nr:hypothetical protein [Accumulibacter sp.]
MTGIVSAQITLVLVKGWDDYGGIVLGGMVRVIFEFSLCFTAKHFWNRIEPMPGWMFDVIQTTLCA